MQHAPRDAGRRAIRTIRVVLATAALSSCADDRPPDAVSDTSAPAHGGSEVSASTSSVAIAAGGPALSIRSIDTRPAAAGGQRFVIEFDRPVPDERVTFVDGVRPTATSHVQYRTQEWTPDDPTPLLTCGDAHSGFSPPATVGQVDVLMPATWFDRPPDADRIDWVHDPQGTQLKMPLCGPHDGYVQLAIWAPASHDPDDIRVHFDDPTRLVLEIVPHGG